MKKELLKGFTMLVLVVVLAFATAVVSANAQSNRVVADIPFEFSVGSKTLPAGEYSAKASDTGCTIMVQSADEKDSAIRLTNSITPPNSKTHARLVFHRYGQRYFLAEVWSGADSGGRQLLESREERAIERELAMISAKSETAKTTYEIVEVVASLR